MKRILLVSALLLHCLTIIAQHHWLPMGVRLTQSGDHLYATYVDPDSPAAKYLQPGTMVKNTQIVGEDDLHFKLSDIINDMENADSKPIYINESNILRPDNPILKGDGVNRIPAQKPEDMGFSFCYHPDCFPCYIGVEMDAFEYAEFIIPTLLREADYFFDVWSEDGKYRITRIRVYAGAYETDPEVKMPWSLTSNSLLGDVEKVFPNAEKENFPDALWLTSEMEWYKLKATLKKKTKPNFSDTDARYLMSIEMEEYYDSEKKAPEDCFEMHIDKIASTGCVFGDCENGHGRYVFEDGSVYQGMHKNSKFHGNGIFNLKNGNTAIGDFIDGNLESGELVLKDGGRYKGKFINNVPNDDNAIFTTSDGASWMGPWKDGKRQGEFYVNEGGLFSDGPHMTYHVRNDTIIKKMPYKYKPTADERAREIVKKRLEYTKSSIAATGHAAVIAEDFIPAFNATGKFYENVYLLFDAKPGKSYIATIMTAQTGPVEIKGKITNFGGKTLVEKTINDFGGHFDLPMITNTAASYHYFHYAISANSDSFPVGVSIIEVSAKK